MWDTFLEFFGWLAMEDMAIWVAQSMYNAIFLGNLYSKTMKFLHLTHFSQNHHQFHLAAIQVHRMDMLRDIKELSRFNVFIKLFFAIKREETSLQVWTILFWTLYAGLVHHIVSKTPTCRPYVLNIDICTCSWYKLRRKIASVCIHRHERSK